MLIPHWPPPQCLACLPAASSCTSQPAASLWRSVHQAVQEAVQEALAGQEVQRPLGAALGQGLSHMLTLHHLFPQSCQHHEALVLRVVTS